MMKTKRTFVVSLIVLQVILVVVAILIVNSLVGFGAAQDPTPYSEATAWILGICAAASIIGSTLAAAVVIKSVGTAAISALTENEGVFFKAFLVITLGEALAIFGLIVAILLWIKIPSFPVV
ncbi:MAG: ATP synthase subunit C [Promethearchaeota archaeon]